MAKASGNALIVGGGVAGMQAALDINAQGFGVYIVERPPSIGGRMAMIDKTFPTLDCSACILTPNLSEVARHPKIKMLTNSEGGSVSGKAGNYKVRLIEHEMVIVSPGIIPPEGMSKLARKLGLPTTDDGYIEIEHSFFGPVTTKDAGVFVCGMADGPKDIPDSVSAGSDAAMKATIVLAKGGE